jgi:hypothetical protein
LQREEEMLVRHNVLRAAHCAPPLTWDAELASAAQRLLDTGNGANCPVRAAHNAALGNFGENFLFGSSAINATDATDSWYRSAREYRPAAATPAFFGMEPTGSSRVWGAFTQLVWKASTRLGCGKRTNCLQQGVYKAGTAWVCRYEQRGNSPQEFAQNVLASGCMHSTPPDERVMVPVPSPPVASTPGASARANFSGVGALRDQDQNRVPPSAMAFIIFGVLLVLAFAFLLYQCKHHRDAGNRGEARDEDTTLIRRMTTVLLQSVVTASFTIQKWIRQPNLIISIAPTFRLEFGGSKRYLVPRTESPVRAQPDNTNLASSAPSHRVLPFPEAANMCPRCAHVPESCWSSQESNVRGSGLPTTEDAVELSQRRMTYALNYDEPDRASA